MDKNERNSLGYLGGEYQFRLVAQILTDSGFAESIIDIVDPNYFEVKELKAIIHVIKEAKRIDDVIPDVGSLQMRLLEGCKDDLQRRLVLTQLNKILESNLNDTLYIQDVAMKFCKQQELKKSIKEISKIIERGNLDDYPECELILRKALDHGNKKDDGIDVFHNIKNVLKEDYRKPILTGINGLDDIMEGGLAKTELGVILAALGVGKTTVVTKMANAAVSAGYNVLQIFFEDTPNVIQRKHLACWSGIELNELTNHVDEIIEMCDKKAREYKGKLILKKFASDCTTIPIIKTYIRKLMAKGLKPDIVFIDYIDCVQPSKQYDDVNVAEGSVMRQFETMLFDLNMAGWVAIQGNRSAIKSEVVDTDQMGGSIKKAQIGHFIMSIARTIDQKDTKRANVAILKSRFGRDGIIYEDVLFDNAKLEIDLTTSSMGSTRTEFKQAGEQQKAARVQEAVMNRKREK